MLPSGPIVMSRGEMASSSFAMKAPVVPSYFIRSLKLPSPTYRLPSGPNAMAPTPNPPASVTKAPPPTSAPDVPSNRQTLPSNQPPT